MYKYLFLIAVLSLASCAGKRKAERIPGSDEEKKQAREITAKGLEDLVKSGDMKNIICQDWDNENDADEAAVLDITSTLDAVYRGYSFFSDGNIVKNPRQDLEVGKWVLNESVKPITISMSFDNGSSEIYQLAYLSPGKMTLAKLHGQEKITTNYTSEAVKNNNIKEDPFYPSNIAWRIKPALPETDKQIKQRLKDCIHFFVLFYQQKIDAKSTAVTFVGLPTCYNFYSGGVSVQNEKNLAKKWINCFYDRQQAIKAQQLAERLIKEHFNLPASASNWLYANLEILKAMEARIDFIN